MEVIRGFAGDDIDVATFYPEDDEFLIDRATIAHHYLVRRGDPPQPA